MKLMIKGSTTQGVITGQVDWKGGARVTLVDSIQLLFMQLTLITVQV